MLFNSVEFLIFFPLVTLLYFLLPHKYRWSMLLLASCVFYMFFKVVYIFILFFTIIIDYYAGILIERAGTQKRKWQYLLMSIVANVGVLAVFKYYNFLNENITGLCQLFGFNNNIPYLHILLPIGLSFHTFQAMSYTIEVYRGNQKAERHFGIYSLYVMFYPQLVAGPIERPQNMLHQFYEKHHFSYENVSLGLKQMCWGFFKKLVIADRLGMYVDVIYNNPDRHSGMSILMATFFFAFQIYCDFSGYSDIALGSARVMGFKLMTNFKRPFFTTSIAEFWTRWHISLSTWLKDYLYYPIAIAKRDWGTGAVIYATLITFMVSGLWHGANWTFVIYGALNGMYVVVGMLTKKMRKKAEKKIGLTSFPVLLKFTQIFSTFLLACFSWIFFRANSVQDAFTVIKKLFTFSGKVFYENPSQLLYCFFGIIFLLMAEGKEEYYKGNISFFNNKSWVVRNLSYAMLVIIILLIGVFDGGQFIYFQF